MAAPQILFEGTTLADRYRIVRPLATGGMGAVYEATDERLGRTVALKVLRPELVEDRELTRRFEREARAAAGLAHPGIAQVLDFGVTPEGLSYLVMEKVPGETLGQLLARTGRLAPARAAALAEQALDALAAAHAAGIVHRDLKPGNVMVFPTGESRESVKLLDFGIAQLAQSDAFTRLTRTGAILGTPSFMSPEQARGEPVDARTDVYAMGVLLFCLLTGQKPFRGELDDVLRAVLRDVPPRADAIAPDVPVELADVAARAMAKDPATRFQGAIEMARAIGQARDAPHVTAPPPTHAPAAPTAHVEPARQAKASSAPSLPVLLAIVLGAPALLALVVVGGLVALTAYGMAATAYLPAPTQPAPYRPAPTPAASAPECALAVSCCHTYLVAIGSDAQSCTYLAAAPDCIETLGNYRELTATEGLDRSACYPQGEAPPPLEASPICQQAHHCCLAWRHHRSLPEDECHAMIEPPFGPFREDMCRGQLEGTRRLLDAFGGYDTECQEEDGH